MKCANCGRGTKNGYFWEGKTVHYICPDCLLSYKELQMNKYDHAMIMRLYKAGVTTERIAVIMGTNKLTIGWIIRKEQKREQTHRSH